MIKKNNFLDNVLWIVGGQILHAVISFLISIIAARAFDKDGYGLINTVISYVSLATAFAALGYNGIITKKFADDPENCNKYIWSGMVFRLIASLASILILQVLVFITNRGDTQRHMLTFINSLTLLFNVFDLIVYWFRYEMLAKVIAIIRIIALLCSAVIKLVGIFVFKNLYVYMAGIASEALFFAILLLYLYFKYATKNKPCFSFNTALEMLKHGYPFIISAFMISIYRQTDKIMLERMLSDGYTAVGLYSASLTIANLISIIPSSIIEGFRPEIMKYKASDSELYMSRFRQIYSLIMWTCLLYGLFVTLFAKQIILIIYSESYLGAVDSLSIIVWYTSFSYIGSVNNIFLVCEGKEKYAQWLTLAGAVCNVALNYLLIPSYGIAGAAFASLSTQILANFIIPCILKPMRPAMKFMLEGVVFKDTLTKEEIMSCKKRIVSLKNKVFRKK